jgi:hypothetical protein
MSTTVGQIQNSVLHKMRVFSNAGEVATGSDIDDYKLSMIPFINLYQKKLSVETNKLKKIYEISHLMPDNQIGTFIENVIHETTSDDNDVTFEAVGSQAYSFQVADTATIFIEEEINSVWTILETINHVSETGEGFVNYSDSTGVGDTDNSVRIRFSGSFRYPYRWVALFADLFVTAPEYAPFVPYDLPTDFYKRNRVDWTFESEQFTDFADYRFDEFDIDNRRIYFKWLDKGEFNVHYYSYPTLISEDGTIGEFDSTVIDMPDEVVPTLVDYIASDLMRDEDAYMSDSFRNQASENTVNLQINSPSDKGRQKIISNDNW